MGTHTEQTAGQCELLKKKKSRRNRRDFFDL